MKSATERMNELAQRTHYLHKMSHEESKAMKTELANMFIDMQTLCHKYGLRLLLCGGSCLGAIRHQDFIPWDDDLDVMMPRRDYQRLIQLLKEGEMGEKYEYSTPLPGIEASNVFLKIYLKNSRDVDLFNVNTPFPKGLYIDVFALDGAPKNRIVRKIKGIAANCLQFASICTLYAKYPSRPLQEFMALDDDAFKQYNFKCRLGKLLGLIPRRRWQWWFDQLVHDEREDGLLCLPTGRMYYEGEVFPSSVYLPSIPATFHGIQAEVPNGYDEYLTNLYHNYMQLPPIEKRERHFICEFQIPTK